MSNYWNSEIEKGSFQHFMHISNKPHIFELCSQPINDFLNQSYWLTKNRNLFIVSVKQNGYSLLYDSCKAIKMFQEKINFGKRHPRLGQPSHNIHLQKTIMANINKNNLPR